MLTVCPLIDGAYPIASKEDAAATNPSVVVEDLRAGSTLATLTVAGGAITNSGNFWICDLNHATASAVQTHLQRTRNALIRLTWGMAAAGGGSDQTEEIVSNTAEHDALLYPEGFIFADSGSGVAISSFAYGNGSRYEPVASLENAATVSVARGSPKRFNIKGTFNGPSGVNGTLLGTEFKEAVVTADSAVSITPASGTTLDVRDAGFEGTIRFHTWRGNATLSSNGAEFRGCRFTSSSGYGWFMGGGTFRDCTIENVAFRTASTLWNFALIGCTFGNSCNLNISVYGSSSPVPLTACTGDVTITMGTTETIEVIGHLAGMITTSGTQPTSISLSGTYQLNNAAGWTIASSVPAAVRPDLTSNIVNLAAGSITPTEAPNLDVAVSSVSGGGGASVQIDSHIRTCPLLNQVAGLEPYPQPLVTFASAPTGTVRARIYDTSVQPVVELTSTPLSGGELALSTATGLSHTYVLDMGHANVTSVVDCMTREGLEALVMIEDGGGSQGQKFVKITCNDLEHVEMLYPEGAIYADKGSGNTGTGFPNGSIHRKCSDLGDASQLIVSRSSKLLDLTGSFSSSGDITAAKIGTRLNGITIRNLGGGDFRIYHPEQIDFNGVSFEGSPTARSFGIRCMRPNTTTPFAKLVGQMGFTHCGIRNVFAYNGGGHTYSVLNFRNCDIRSSSMPTVGVWDNLNPFSATSLYALIFTDCDFQPGGCTLDLRNMQADLDVISSSGDFTIQNFSSGTYNPNADINLLRCRGSGDITLASSVVNCTVNASGVYNSVINNGTGNTINEKQLAHTSGLTGNIVNLAPNSVTPTEAPNLDVAVSSVGGGGSGGTDWTTTEKNQIRHRLSLDGTHAVPTSTHGDIYDLTTRITASRATNLDNLDATISSRSTFDPASASVTVSGTIQTLDALDTAQDSQHAITQADLATLIARLTAARAANLDNLDAASSSLATSSALSAVATDVSSLLARIGVNDLAILKGLSLGNYVLDGGPGSPSVSYDANDHAATMRLRVFDTSSNTNAATFGASSPEAGEIGTVTITSTPTAGKAYPASLKGVLT